MANTSAPKNAWQKIRSVFSDKAKRKKLGNILFYIFITVLAVLIVIGLYSKLTGKQVLPRKPYWVLTDSMEPTIPARSYVMIKAADGSEVEVDDVITFHDAALGGELNTHRVVEIDQNGYFVTRGDHYTDNDANHVAPASVVGIYVRNMPLLTFFGRLFSNMYGFVIAGIVFMMLIFGWFSIYRAHLEKKEKQKEIDRRVAEEIARLERENAGKKPQGKQ